MKELRWCTSTSAAHSLVKYFQASQEMLVLRWFLLNREDEGEAAGLERTKSENTWNMSEKNTLMCAKIDSAVRALAVDYVSHSPIQVAVVGRARTCKSLLQKDKKKLVRVGRGKDNKDGSKSSFQWGDLSSIALNRSELAEPIEGLLQSLTKKISTSWQEI